MPLSPRLVAVTALLTVLGGLVTAGRPVPAPGPTSRVIDLRECLMLRSVARGGRSPIHRDPIEARIVAGTWIAPTAGERVPLPDGTSQAWEPLSAASDGSFSGPGLAGGYVFASVHVTAPRVMLLEASGHTMVYLNGEPRAGDPYETGWTRLPVRLHAGKNALLFHCARGRVRARLVEPEAPVTLDAHDATLPDLRVGVRVSSPVLGAVVAVNATTFPVSDLLISASRTQSSEAVSHVTVLPVPPIPPLSIRKVAFAVPLLDAPPKRPGDLQITLALDRLRSRSLQPLHRATVRLRIRKPEQTYKQTFFSGIDGSLQYYAVNPAPPPRGPASQPPALFLSLHGAGVEAIGQADAYEGKSWGHLVAPTNRRPYGFDWEDWGRLDALEVLEDAQRRLRTDPRRTYLTGHSMGGHGTWHLGVTYPDRFAAIGPSAGWISFQTYTRGGGDAEQSPMDQLLARGRLPGDTLALARNLRAEGVYVLHGAADDNVPVRESRRMREQLSGFHTDFEYFEQPSAGHWWDVSDEPGADCVDWPPMFDFFARHSRPTDESLREVEFATADPGVSSGAHWVAIEAQTRRLQLSTFRIRFDPGRRRFRGTTNNVARLTLRLDRLAVAGKVEIELDGQRLPALSLSPTTREIWLARRGESWRVAGPPSPLAKGPERCGPFKQAFRRRFMLVYGTKGTAEENTWALAKARFDAETFWYRGNGSIDVIPDSSFDASRDRERSVILYGNAQTHAAWASLLSGSPVTVSRGSIRIGARELAGHDLACLFLRPRPGSRRACVGVVAGTGPAGMRLTDRLPYFTSGVAYPDLIVLGPETLLQGSRGVRVAGFFGNDWDLPTGELVWGP